MVSTLVLIVILAVALIIGITLFLLWVLGYFGDGEPT